MKRQVNNQYLVSTEEDEGSMRKNIVRKVLVVEIIFLFFGLCFLSYSDHVVSKNKIVGESDRVNNDNNFDSKIDLLMKFGHMPSLSACIIKNDSIQWYKGYGYCDRSHKKIPTENTIYMVASISKTFTAVALLQLYEQGLVTLDDNVSTYLPFNLKNPKYPEVNITLRMLLSHQSSIIEENKVLFPLYFTFLGYSFDWFDEFLLPGGGIYNEKLWADYPPGDSYNYSSINTAIVGYIVEHISHQPFNEYCKDHIFKPLEMFNSSFNLCELKYSDIAVPYLWIPGFYIPLPHIDTGNVSYPAGGLRTTISDLSHYLIAHMNNGFYNGKRILKNETMELMHSVQYPGSFDGNYTYGLCWMIWNESNETYGGHSGGILGGRAEMWYRQSDNTGVIYFWNQYEFIDVGERPIEEKAQQKIDALLWEKAGQFL
jgi:CubicO group peptidase (beta-lactamase class C family)